MKKIVYIFPVLGSFLGLSQISAQASAVYTDAQAAYKRGESHYEQALYGSAQAAFQEVLDLSPQRSAHEELVPAFFEEAQLFYALSALQRGDAEAERKLQAFIAQHEPSSLAMRARLEMGRFYYNKRQYAQAIENFSAIRSLDMSTEEVNEMKFQLGYSYFVQKQFNKAAPLFQQIKGNSKSEYYYPSNYYLGITQFIQDKHDDALESFKMVSASKKYQYIVPSYICQIFFAQGKYPELIAYAEPLSNQNSLKDKETVEQLLGQAYFEMGQYQKAKPQLEKLLAGNSKLSPELLYQIAYTQYKTGSYDKALENFSQLNALQSALGQNALYNMGDCYLKKGDKAAARQSFRAASQLKFDNTVQDDALFNYAKLSFELGFDAEAIEGLKSIKSESPNYNEAQNLLSDIFLNTRDYDKALAILRKIEKPTPKIRETHQKVAYFRGVQHYQDKNSAEAVKLFDESLNLGVHTETKALGHFWKAEALYRQEQFDAAIKEYDRYGIIAPTLKNIPANSSTGVAFYGLGYAYLRKEEYSTAAEQFAKAVSTIEKQGSKINDRYVSDFVYPDALLRAGDCYLMQGGSRNYDRAKGFYQKVVSKKYNNSDYALYQLSLIYSLGSDADNVNQLTTLNKIINEFPNSPYADDALYSKGVVYMNQNKLDLAQRSFEDLQTQHPNSEFKNRSLMRLGVMAFAQGRNEEALNYYKGVFRNNPQGEEAKDALAGIQEIYIEMGNPDGYFNFINTVPDYKPSESDRDSITFRSAERLYRSQDWARAADVFAQYLQRAPKGAYSLRAHFLRGECYFDLKDFDKAYTDYVQVTGRPQSTHSETANYRAGVIAYHHKKDFAAAYLHFKVLLNLASTEQMRYDAKQYLMRAAFFAGKFAELPDAAKDFLQETRPNNAERAEAHYYMAKAYQVNKNYAQARASFEKTIELSDTDIRAAESRHQLAQLLYAERKLDEALQHCMSNNRLMSNYDYWLVKNYVLMADIYAEKGNLVQAKMTLESILANYRGDQDLVDEVRRKLEAVKRAEADASRLAPGGNDSRIEMQD